MDGPREAACSPAALGSTHPETNTSALVPALYASPRSEIHTGLVNGAATPPQPPAVEVRGGGLLQGWVGEKRKEGREKMHEREAEPQCNQKPRRTNSKHKVPFCNSRGCLTSLPRHSKAYILLFISCKKQQIWFIIHIAHRNNHRLAPTISEPDVHHSTIYNGDKPEPWPTSTRIQKISLTKYYAAIKKASLSRTFNKRGNVN